MEIAFSLFGRGSTPMVRGNNGNCIFVGVGAPPILVYFSGWIGMFTGGTIWVLTHGPILEGLERHGKDGKCIFMIFWFGWKKPPQ